MANPTVRLDKLEKAIKPPKPAIMVIFRNMETGEVDINGERMSAEEFERRFPPETRRNWYTMATGVDITLL